MTNELINKTRELNEESRLRREGNRERNKHKPQKEIDRSKKIIITDHTEKDIKAKEERQKSEANFSKKLIHKLVPEEKTDNYRCQRLG